MGGQSGVWRAMMLVMTEAIAAAARSAPSGAGVYCFLAEDRELLYIGKAASLRRRLNDHARSDPVLSPRLATMYARVDAVGWEECATEEEAACREADLIVALRPVFNASYSAQTTDHFIDVTFRPGPPTAVFRLGSTGRYGCFPHLTKGTASHPAKVHKAGWTAMLRLLWVAHSEVAAPRRISGPAPPDRHEAQVDGALRRPLADYLNGRSARVVDILVGRAFVPAYARPALVRDRDAALAFYDSGTRRMSLLRRQAGLGAGPISGEEFSRLMAAGFTTAVGPFWSGRTAPSAADPLGPAWSRGVELRAAVRRISSGA